MLQRLYSSEKEILVLRKVILFHLLMFHTKAAPISRVRSQGGKEKDLLMKKGFFFLMVKLIAIDLIGERNANAGVDVHVTETDMEKEEEVSQDEGKLILENKN